MTGNPGRFLLVLGAVLLLAPSGMARAAESLAIEATLDRERIVAGMEVATLTVSVRTTGLQIPDVPAPQVPGLRFEPAGTAQNFSMINGGIYRSLTQAFRVRAERPGSYTIGPLRVSLGSQRAETRPIALTAVPPGAPSPGPRAGASESWQGSAGGPPELFARLTIDRSRALWNQQITAHVRIYARVQVEGAPDYKPPDTPGFWVEELGQPRLERTRVGGVEYVVNDLALALFPTRTGRLTIGAAHIRCRVQHAVQRNDPWGLLGMEQVVPEDVSLETSPLSVTVDPLPAGAPPGFSGAVGSYALSVKVDRIDAEAGEPVTVTTTIDGEGNIASLRDPPITGAAGVRRYAAGSSTSTDRSGDRIRGKRTQQVAFLSDAPGAIHIEPVEFAWFDPEAGQYRSARSDTIRVRIHPATPGGPTSAAPALIGPLAPPRGRPGPFGTLTVDPPPGSLALEAVALAGYALAWGVARRRERRRLDPRLARVAGIDRLLSRDLPAARTRLAAAGPDAAAALAHAALLLGVALRFDVPRAGQTGRELIDAVRGRGATEADAEEIGSLLAELEAMAYAPPESRSATAARDLDRIEHLLQRYRRSLS